MKRKRWVWELYFVFFAVSTLNQAINVFIPNTPLYNFHHILMAFDNWLVVLYVVRVACELLNVVNLIPLFLYTLDLTWLDRRIWQGLVLSRITFDMAGHYYEFVTLKSMYLSKPTIGLQLLAWALLWIIPSYYACLSYAFAPKSGSGKAHAARSGQK